MSAEIAIQVNNLYKRYARTKPELDLRRSIKHWLQPSPKEWFWALEDVSFEVHQGEIVGIMGLNGSGKSTLMRILCGITQPTRGTVQINGSIGSILDIGAGFHPDFTGRENVFLNGQLFGMSRRQIAARFDEIVTFSEIGPFIDTPVKHYSDGMFLRLAFSFLTHLKADILLFDEVLSVGDLAFQQKCMARIREIAQNGTTILFVSHNPLELVDVCNTFLHLEKGRLKYFEKSTSVLVNYINEALPMEAQAQVLEKEKFALETRWDDLHTAPGNHLFRLCRVRLAAAETNAAPHLYTDQDLLLEIHFKKRTDEHTIDIAFTVGDMLKHEIMACSSHRVHQYFSSQHSGDYYVACTLPGGWLNQGIFRISLMAILDRTNIFYAIREVLVFKVENRIKYDHTDSKLVNAPIALAPALKWTLSGPNPED
ncbi:MAG TPA: ABC transporter ATP-binding protein [Saprospiraceae bacterium]|nr:ABC transporter ATP-binding protein [Saprospiraceae bacterium]HMP24397.1 ABC transporter ATP-binding protein [Saprospiraceae bacterium]